MKTFDEMNQAEQTLWHLSIDLGGKVWEEKDWSHTYRPEFIYWFIDMHKPNLAQQIQYGRFMRNTTCRVQFGAFMLLLECSEELWAKRENCRHGVAK